MGSLSYWVEDKEKGDDKVRQLMQSKGLLGFIYGVFVIGLYAAANQAASATILVGTAEVLAWAMVAGSNLQLRRVNAKAERQTLQRWQFPYFPIIGYFFFYNPLWGAGSFNYVDLIELAFLTVVTLWGYQIFKARA